MSRYIVILLLVLIATVCQSQGIIVRDVDESGFPEIKVRFSVETSEQIPSNLEIFENGNKIEYKLSSVSEEKDDNEGNTYIVLIENSYFFTKNKIFDELYASLNSIIDMAKENDKINILYYGIKPPKSGSVCYINAEPTGNFRILKKMVSKQFVPNTDSTFIDNQLFESLEEVSTYAQQIAPSNNTKILFFIGRGLNLGNMLELPESFFNTIRNGQVYYNVLMYDSKSQNAQKDLLRMAELSGGSFSMFQQGTLEQRLAQMFEKTSKNNPKKQTSVFVAQFATSQRGMINTFEMKFQGNIVQGSFSNPHYEGIFGQHPLTVVSVALLAVLAVIMLLYWLARRKVLKSISIQEIQRVREIQHQNRVLKKELDKYRKHPISVVHSFDNFNAGETLIGSGKIIPKILIECDGEQSSFDLTKLVMTIGRNADNDIVINNRTISGRHATLSYEGGFFYITDNNSTNGVFVNDIRIEKNKVHTGDIIRFGAIFAKLKY